MLILILTVILGLLFAAFAGQNTDLVTIRLGDYLLQQVPLYGVVLVSLLIGLVISFVIQLTNELFATLAMHSKNTEIKTLQRENEKLKQDLHQIEVKKAELKGETEVRREQEIKK